MFVCYIPCPETSMSRGTLLLCGWLMSALALYAQQTSIPTPNEADFVLRNFRFNSGVKLPEVRLPHDGVRMANQDRIGDPTGGILLRLGEGVVVHANFGELFARVLFGP